MPEIIQTTVYRFNELLPPAQENARDWYRQHGLCDDWFHFVFEDFERICEILGLTIKTYSVRLRSGSTRGAPCIWFSGFWSQGDGACFEGWYQYAKRAPKAIPDYAPKDEALHAIADTLRDIQRRNFYQLSATTTHRDRYYHEYTMDIETRRDSHSGQDMSADAESVIVETMRKLARWLYRQLEQEHEWLSSDNQIDEAIRDNGYTFTEAGRRFG